MTYRIAEVAEMTGVPATTIRYYEDEGLLRPVEREANGYRSFGDRDVARLRFINRARSLDLPIEDLRQLVELWEDDDCEDVADRMRAQVTDRLVDVQNRIAELMALAGELHRVAHRLDGASVAGPCGDACVCVDHVGGSVPVPLVAPAPESDEVIACSLEPSEMPARVTDWQSLLARATHREPVTGGVSVYFPPEPDLAGELAELAAAEQGCCSFFDLSLRITATDFQLVVLAPEDAAPVVDAIFGASLHNHLDVASA